MSKSILNRFVTRVRALGDDERGAESAEIMIVLVVLVVGLLSAWAFLRDKIKASGTRTGNCIAGANTSTNC